MEKQENPSVAGRYEMRDGKRVLVEEPTQDHPEGNRARTADGKPVPAPALERKDDAPASPAANGKGAD